MPHQERYITWKQAIIGVGIAVGMAATSLAWVDNKKLDVDNAQSMEEDIRLIKKCVIEKKC